MSLRPALGRPMDLSYLSNRAITFGTPVIGAIVGVIALIRSEPLVEAFRWGFFGAGAAFLAWAIAREIHPDQTWVATVATLIAPFGLLWGRSDLLTSGLILLVARAVAGTTGRSLRAGDLVLLTAVGAPLVVRASGPAALGVGAIGLAITILWHERHRVVHVVATVWLAAGAVTAIVLRDGPLLVTPDSYLLVWVGLGAAAVALLGPRVVLVETDRSGGVIVPLRVRAARLFVLLAGVAVAVTHDPAAMAPVWAALVATALHPR